eukprot:CAMPEP_0176460500 /NCGR_PEP_ID=MMETSP0127-20121128/34016_1 /TAXON_ID=938130 /ORGANISM="Platyophrya macrostoma, Strain WH" /LENGTH=152 /DNA_ID=CAMNT_0017851853 /DNA_START=116 /DNA_END=574 /DNA_ORIENTATION=-
MYGVCIGFCLLTACVAFFISLLMSGQTLATFTIPAFEHDWDLQTKAAGCRNAGFMYLLVAIGLTAKACLYPDVSTSCPESRAQYNYGVNSFSQREISPLILGGRSASIPEEEEDEMPTEGFMVSQREGFSTRRQRTTGGGAYGSVEMQNIVE